MFVNLHKTADSGNYCSLWPLTPQNSTEPPSILSACSYIHEIRTKIIRNIIWLLRDHKSFCIQLFERIYIMLHYKNMTEQHDSWLSSLLAGCPGYMLHCCRDACTLQQPSDERECLSEESLCVCVCVCEKGVLLLTPHRLGCVGEVQLPGTYCRRCALFLLSVPLCTPPPPPPWLLGMGSLALWGKTYSIYVKPLQKNDC